MNKQILWCVMVMGCQSLCSSFGGGEGLAFKPVRTESSVDASQSAKRLRIASPAALIVASQSENLSSSSSSISSRADVSNDIGQENAGKLVFELWMEAAGYTIVPENKIKEAEDLLNNEDTEKRKERLLRQAYPEYAADIENRYAAGTPDSAV